MCIEREGEGERARYTPAEKVFGVGEHRQQQLHQKGTEGN
jgi:hypothetical protein